MEETKLLLWVVVGAAISFTGLMIMKRTIDNRLYRSGAFGPLVNDVRHTLNAAGLCWVIGVYTLMIYGAASFLPVSSNITVPVLWVAAGFFGPLTGLAALRSWYLARLVTKR